MPFQQFIFFISRGFNLALQFWTLLFNINQTKYYTDEKKSQENTI